MKKNIICGALLAAMATVSYAHTVDGVVKDQKTGEPLIGTVIKVKELPAISTTSGLDGTFSLHELPKNGRYTLVVTYLSYKTKEIQIDVSGKGHIEIPLDEDTQQLGEVIVTGHNEYHSDRSAIDLEKNAGNVLNVMSQQSIQLSPDVNVASVLQRVSGVTMERDASGEASYAILRGMDKRYNYTLVNGVKIPSPDDKNRYIPLNIFPSDLMDRLVVTKSLTADMEGDAAGGGRHGDERRPSALQASSKRSYWHERLLFEQRPRLPVVRPIQHHDQSPLREIRQRIQSYGSRLQKRSNRHKPPLHACT